MALWTAQTKNSASLTAQTKSEMSKQQLNAIFMDGNNIIFMDGNNMEYRPFSQNLWEAVAKS